MSLSLGSYDVNKASCDVIITIRFSCDVIITIRFSCDVIITIRFRCDVIITLRIDAKGDLKSSNIFNILKQT